MSKKAKANRAEERRLARRGPWSNLYLASKDSLTAGSLVDGARMYAASADAVNARYPSCIFPISQLLCTSIELSLKAFLRHKGTDEDRLVKLGHDLPSILTEAVGVGLLDTGSRLLILTVAGQNYREKTFSVYPEQGLMRSIATWRLRAMCHELLVREAFTAIKGATDFRGHEQGSPAFALKGPTRRICPRPHRAAGRAGGQASS